MAKVWRLVVLLLLGFHASAMARDVTLMFSHPVPGVGEEVFLYAVPQQLGYFAAEKLDVTPQFGSSVIFAAQAVQSGAGQFGTTMADLVLQTREQGGDLLAVYNVKRNNGQSVAVLANSPITRLEDLRGKTLGSVEWASMGGLALIATLNDLGIKGDDYDRVLTGIGPAAAAALRSGHVDGLVLWDAMYASMENAGLKLRYIDLPLARKLAAYSLVTTDRFAAAEPEVVAGFCRAVSKGVAFTRDHPEEAIKALMAAFPNLAPPTDKADEVTRNDMHILSTYMANALEGLKEGDRIGENRRVVWDTVEQFYQSIGKLKGAKPVDAAYTNRFVP